MLAALDIGNTNIVLALHDGNNWINSWRVYTDQRKTGDEYYVIFNKDTIKQLRDKFMQEKRTDLVNLEHSKGANNIYLIDSFIKDTSKGISPAGFEDIEDGSWFVSYKVDNEQVWNKIKSGEFRGFSIEGVFEFAPVEHKDELEDLIDEILQ